MLAENRTVARGGFIPLLGTRAGGGHDMCNGNGDVLMDVHAPDELRNKHCETSKGRIRTEKEVEWVF